MFSKEEAAGIRKEFWTNLGKRLKAHLSYEGYAINWINYNTGLKDILFKMDFTNKSATIGICLTHRDRSTSSLIYEQFEEFKKLFHAVMMEDWNWVSPEEIALLGSEPIISKTLETVNIYNKTHWDAVNEFLISRIRLLDEFWSDARHVFKDLVS